MIYSHEAAEGVLYLCQLGRRLPSHGIQIHWMTYTSNETPTGQESALPGSGLLFHPLHHENRSSAEYGCVGEGFLNVFKLNRFCSKGHILQCEHCFTSFCSKSVPVPALFVDASMRRIQNPPIIKPHGCIWSKVMLCSKWMDLPANKMAPRY